MIKILKIFFLKYEKVFKTFLKMKYNRLSLFIYLKEFRHLYRYSATAHSAQGGPQQAPNIIVLERTAPQEPKKKMKGQKREKERNKKREKKQPKI